MRCLGNCVKTIFAPENPSIWRLWTLTVYLERSAGKPTHSLVVVQASTEHSDCAIYIYIFHVVLFSAVAPKGRNFGRSCKEKSFFCNKNAVVMSPFGRAMSPFGRAMSPLQNDYNYLENLKKRRSAKKRLFFRKSCFSSKKAEF